MKSMLLSFTLLFCLSVYGQEAALQAFVSSGGLKNAAIGIAVKRVRDGRMMVAYHPEMALRPASVTKLMATILALKERGATYVYQTEISYTGVIGNGVLEGDIIIHAAGDPCFDSRYFPEYKCMEKLVTVIRQAGIRKIRGRIRIEGAGQDILVPGSWPWEDISNYYGALYFPFNYRDNMYELELSSGKAGDVTQLLRVVPAQRHLTFRNEVKASALPGDNAWIYGGPYSETMHLEGTIPQNQRSFKIKGAMHRPADSFIAELAELLLQEGITIENKNVKGDEKHWITLNSPTLEEIVFYTNKKSVNLFAEAVGKLVAKEGYEAEVKTLCRGMGIDDDGITLKDACGLSPLNAVPAVVFTDLLLWAHHNLGECFLGSLPVAGGDIVLNGGLNSYYGGVSALKNNLQAKTGSFAGVRCLAGYLNNKAGERFAFTILVNNYTCTTASLQENMRKFLMALAR